MDKVDEVVLGILNATRDIYAEFNDEFTRQKWSDAIKKVAPLWSVYLDGNTPEIVDKNMFVAKLFYSGKAIFVEVKPLHCGALGQMDINIRIMG